MKEYKFKILQFFTAITIITFAGCASDSIEDIHPGIYGQTGVCDTAGMTYDKDMTPLFLTSCGSNDNGCHKTPNPQDVNLDNYSDAKDVALSGDMMGSVLHLPGYHPMPDNGGKLSDCSINKIQAWINNGCPQ